MCCAYLVAAILFTALSLIRTGSLLPAALSHEAWVPTWGSLDSSGFVLGDVLALPGLRAHRGTPVHAHLRFSAADNCAVRVSVFSAKA